MTPTDKPPAHAKGRPAAPSRATAQRKTHLRLGATAARIEARLDRAALAALERLRTALALRTGRTPSLSVIVNEALAVAAPPPSGGTGLR